MPRISNMTLLRLMPFHGLTNYQLVQELRPEGLIIKDKLADLNFKAFLERTVPAELNDIGSCRYYDVPDFKVMHRKLKGTISLIHVNLQSGYKNYSVLKSHLDTLHFEFDVICITEAGRGNEDRCANIMGENYNFFYCESMQNKGGVGLYIKKKFNSTKRNDLNFPISPDVENLWYEIEHVNHKYIVGVTYRHPGYNTTNFCDALNASLTKSAKEGKITLLCGDFNIDLLKPEHPQTAPYIDALLETNVIPCITLPTRITHQSATLIDHINIRLPGKNLNKKTTSGNLLLEIADHLPNFIILSGDKYNETSRPTTRHFSERNLANFKTKLAGQNWEDIVTQNQNTEESYNAFLNTFQSLFNECFPLKRQSKREAKTNKKWLTIGLEISIKHKARLYKKFLRKPTDLNRLIYKNYKNKLTNLIRKMEQEYYKALLLRYKNSARGIWKVYGELLNTQKGKKCTSIKTLNFKDQIVTDDNDIANTFNNYFANIGSNLAKGFPKNKYFLDYLATPNENNMFLTPVTEGEVSKDIGNLLPNKSAGHDEIPPRVIKHVSNVIVKPLTCIYNKSFKDACVPCKLKTAKVIPIYKKGEHHNPGNYRPISLLSIYNKLLEKLMYRRVLSFLNKHNLIYDYQFGFRKGHSTMMATAEILENIRDELEKGHFVIGVYLDLSKAFDTVSHEILFSKLQHYGIRGHVLDWFKSYLANRRQLTFCNNTYSKEEAVTTGVPQGSVLGPLLFLIYMNDIHRSVSDTSLRLFADDTNLFLSNTNLASAERETISSLRKLQQWFTDNQLTLNIDKTCFTIFGGKNTCNSLRSIEFDQHIIKRVEFTKYLGLNVDEQLHWQAHVDYVHQKLSKLTSVFFSISRFINRDMAKQIYYAYVYPHITYCIEIYGSANASVAKKIQTIQNKLLKILCRKSYRYPTYELHHELGLLTVKEIYEFRVLCFVYKQRAHTLPTVFDNYYMPNSALHNRITRQNNDLHIRSYKTRVGKLSIRVSGATFWNKLPLDIKNTQSFKNFKSKCKNYLLNR